MNLNIGTAGCTAAHALQANRDWAIFREAMADVTRKFANSALDAPPELQASACGYARALRDVVIAIESATTGVPQLQVKKPGVEK